MEKLKELVLIIQYGRDLPAYRNHNFVPAPEWRYKGCVVACPAGYPAWPGFEIRKILLPDQRSVAEDPAGLGDGHLINLKVNWAIAMDS